METTPSNILPILSIVIAAASILLAFVRFGREVRVDEKKELQLQLDELKKNCTKLREDHDALERENKRLQAQNLELMQRLLKLNNGANK